MDNAQKSAKPKDKEEVKKQEVQPEEVPQNDEVEKLKKEVEEYKARYLRAIADYQNFERRAREEKNELMKSSQGRVLERLLPVLDFIDQAEIFVKDPGLKMVKDTFVKILQELGVKEIELLDKEYDPYTSEALEVVEGEKDNWVIGVLRKAYEFNGKVIRIGQVKVSKKVN